MPVTNRILRLFLLRRTLDGYGTERRSRTPTSVVGGMSDIPVLPKNVVHGPEQKSIAYFCCAEHDAVTLPSCAASYDLGWLVHPGSCSFLAASSAFELRTVAIEYRVHFYQNSFCVGQNRP